MYVVNKGSEVCIKTRSPSALLPFKSLVTEQTTVKWSICDLASDPVVTNLKHLVCISLGWLEQSNNSPVVIAQIIHEYKSLAKSMLQT